MGSFFQKIRLTEMQHFIRHFLACGNHILHDFAEALCTVFVKLRIGFGGIAFKNGTMTFQAVSYTHLDVYKRQDKVLAVPIRFRLGSKEYVDRIEYGARYLPTR